MPNETSHVASISDTDDRTLPESEEQVANYKKKGQDDIGFAMMVGPSMWRSRAEVLKYAADALWDEQERRNELLRQIIGNDDPEVRQAIKDNPPHLWMGWSVLAAFVLENYLKGILVVHDPDFVKEGKINTGKYGHNLVTIADAVGFTVSTEERTLLFVLSNTMNWGRYPSPTKATNATESVEIGSEDVERYVGLCERLDEELLRRISSGEWKPH